MRIMPSSYLVPAFFLASISCLSLSAFCRSSCLLWSFLAKIFFLPPLILVSGPDLPLPARNQIVSQMSKIFSFDVPRPLGTLGSKSSLRPWAMSTSGGTWTSLISLFGTKRIFICLTFLFGSTKVTPSITTFMNPSTLASKTLLAR